MAEEHVYSTFTKSGTTFTISRIHEGDFTNSIRATGRLNFVRHIQTYDAYLINTGSFLQMLRYVLRGSFTLMEEGEKYSFEPSSDGWLVAYPGGLLEFVGDTEVLKIIAGDLNICDYIREQNMGELVGGESKRAITALSEMLRKNAFNQSEYNRIRIYADETNDARVKDMLKIVKNRFRLSNDNASAIDIHIIE